MLDGAQIADFAIFSDLSPDQRAAIARLGRIEQFDRGEEIFQQDTPATLFYGLLEGEIDLVLKVEEQVLQHQIDYEEALTVRHEVIEKPVVVDTLHRGDVFGWSSLVTPSGIMTATARCRQPSQALVIPGAELLKLFSADPSLGYRFMERLVGIISSRLRHRTERLTEAWAEAFGS
jgi:CRP-like cAMP-binding protein